MRILLILLLLPVNACFAGNFTTRIIGGGNADTNEWPTMVQLIQTTTEGPAFYCAGTLISDSWVLTAAHCFVNNTGTLVTSPSGRSVLVKSSGTLATGEQITVQQIFVHPEYRLANTDDADIALIELDSPVVNPELQNLYSGTPGAGCEATIVGWGATTAQGTTASSTLMEATVPLADQAICNSAMQSRITDHMMCAGYAAGGVDTCQGDSGGPLLLVQDGEYRQVGVTSWGPATCGAANQYGVYTRVENFVEWIQGTTGLTSFAPQSNAVCSLSEVSQPTQQEPDEPAGEVPQQQPTEGGGGLGGFLLLVAALGLQRKRVSTPV